MNTRTLAGALAIVSLSSLAYAQAPAPQASEQRTIQQQNEQILQELRAIRLLLERPAPAQVAQVPVRPRTAKLTNLSGPILGRPDAPLTMVEFVDLQCPFCRQYATTSLDDIRRNWIETGKLRYISRDYPLDFHVHAMRAARAARCSGEQGKFWEMRLALMRNGNLLSADYIAKTAADLKLDVKVFVNCTAGNKHDADIQADMAEARKIGVSGTPTFVLGRTTPDGVEGPVVVGAVPYSVFEGKLKELMDPTGR